MEIPKLEQCSSMAYRHVKKNSTILDTLNDYDNF